MPSDKSTSNKVASPPVAIQSLLQRSPTKPQTVLHPLPLPPASTTTTFTSSAANNHKRKTSTTSPSNVSPPTSCGSTTSTSSTSTCNSTTLQPPKRHKPMSLNLSAPNNADLALRIVSPGLPPLDDEMKSTIKLSQKIQQQQRHLIASRHGLDVDQDKLFQDHSDAFMDEDVLPDKSYKPLPETISKSQTTSPNESDKQPGELEDTKGIYLLQSENKENTVDGSETPTKSPVYALDDSDITRLSGLKNRRMKRNNVPTPLNIGITSNKCPPSSVNPKSNIAPLSIRSAPIRSAPPRPTINMKPRARQFGNIPPPHRPINLHQMPPMYQQQQQQQPYYYPPPPRTARNGPSMAYNLRHGRPLAPPQHQQPLGPLSRGVRLMPVPSATAQQFPMRYLPIVPPSSTMLNFQQRQYQQQMQSSQSQRGVNAAPTGRVQGQGQRAGVVTDVFSGNLQKAAPLQSQPLSSQVEYFKRAHASGLLDQGGDDEDDEVAEVDIDDDKAPVSQDEIEEMQQKYASNRTVIPQYVPSYQQQYQQQYSGANGPMMMMMTTTPMAAPAPAPAGYSPPSSSGSRGEVFGSINFMNESIFNFRIFERKNKSGEEQSNNNTGAGESANIDYDAEKEALSAPSSGSASSLESKIKLASSNVNESVSNADVPAEADEGLSSQNEEKKPQDASEVEKNKEVEGNDDGIDIEKDDGHKTNNEINEDWLKYEKEKFMKICETCWDEFVKSRNEET